LQDPVPARQEGVEPRASSGGTGPGSRYLAADDPQQPCPDCTGGQGVDP
jgi:hypothetical protein